MQNVNGLPIIKGKPQAAEPQHGVISNNELMTAIRMLEVIEPSEIQCLEFRVLLKIADCSRLSEGGVILPAERIEKDLFAGTVAEVVNFGDECWLNADGTPISNRPKVGDRVLIAKYAGIPFRDANYNLFRFANDKDITCILRDGGKSASEGLTKLEKKEKNA